MTAKTLTPVGWLVVFVCMAIATAPVWLSVLVTMLVNA